MNSRPRIAGLISTYHQFAHGQHICDRFLEGCGWNGRGDIGHLAAHPVRLRILLKSAELYAFQFQPPSR